MKKFVLVLLLLTVGCGDNRIGKLESDVGDVKNNVVEIKSSIKELAGTVGDQSKYLNKVGGRLEKLEKIDQAVDTNRGTALAARDESRRQYAERLAADSAKPIVDELKGLRSSLDLIAQHLKDEKHRELMEALAAIHHNGNVQGEELHDLSTRLGKLEEDASISKQLKDLIPHLRRQIDQVQKKD